MDPKKMNLKMRQYHKRHKVRSNSDKRSTNTSVPMAGFLSFFFFFFLNPPRILFIQINIAYAALATQTGECLRERRGSEQAAEVNTSQTRVFFPLKLQCKI